MNASIEEYWAPAARRKASAECDRPRHSLMFGTCVSVCVYIYVHNNVCICIYIHICECTCICISICTTFHMYVFECSISIRYTYICGYIKYMQTSLASPRGARQSAQGASASAEPARLLRRYQYSSSMSKPVANLTTLAADIVVVITSCPGWCWAVGTERTLMASDETLDHHGCSCCDHWQHAYE